MGREINYQNEAYDQIKNMILKAVLVPGQRVSKNELVERLGIGDTPVREAIILLRKEGLLQIVPQSGTYISKINMKEIFEAKYMRETIEKMIYLDACDNITSDQLVELEHKLAVQRKYFEAKDQDMYFKLDDEFHQFFYQMVNKSFVWQFMQDINTSFNRCRYLRLEVKELKWQSIIEQHEQMVELIKNKKKNELSALVSEHIQMIDSDVTIIQKSFPDYFDPID